MAQSAGLIPGLPQEYTDLVNLMRDTQNELAKKVEAQQQVRPRPIASRPGGVGGRLAVGRRVSARAKAVGVRRGHLNTSAAGTCATPPPSRCLQLETQYTENNMVKEELASEPSAVYKLSGRVLVKQDVGDARSTVARRLEYIQAEMCVALGEQAAGSTATSLGTSVPRRRRVGLP